MERDRIYGVRDPFGNRPLCIGKIMADSQGKRLYVQCIEAYSYTIREN